MLDWKFNSTEITTNTNYTGIAKTMIEKIMANQNSPYYISESVFSIQLTGVANYLYEYTSYANFYAKLNELGMNNVKYLNVSYTAQPLGKHNVLANYQGDLDINGSVYKFSSSIIIKVNSLFNNITHHIINIFY